jgi:quercetin dioxygenase-like cupin family protein
MKSFKLNEMTKGWFVGDFLPVALKTSDAEVAIKEYKAGEKEIEHVHKIATEVTVIVSGRVRMFEQEWAAGDIIVTEPNEYTAFIALEDTLTVVVKTPSVAGDKYILGN